MGVHMLATVVDTERYPITDPGSPAWVRAVEAACADLRTGGCRVLPGFVRAGALEALRAEGAQAAPAAYHDVVTVNVYNTTPDPSLPADHPAHLQMQRGNAFVARDLLPADGILARLYRDPLLARFVAACFELPAVYELADPLAGLVLNVLSPGREHPWHFDTNEFTVSMLTRTGAGGGVFEYCPAIRSPAAENLDDVRAVLEGRADHLVRRLQLRPGDLQLFRGRYSLHRVTRVHGTQARHCAILAYSEQPGVVGTAERARQLFGRVDEMHLRARDIRVDQLLD